MNLMSPVNLALLAVLLTLTSSVVSLGSGGRPWLLRYVAMACLGLSGIASVTTGLWSLQVQTADLLQLPMGLPWLPWQVRLDALSGFFLLIIGLITTAVAIYAPGYVTEYQNGRDSLPVLGGFTGLFVAGMQLVVLADDAFLFMVAWELMSLSSYFLVTFQHEQSASRRAGLLYLIMAHISGLTILLAFGVLAGFGGTFSFEAMRLAELSPGWGSAAFGLALLGFGTKAGLVPLHAWLPEAHPAAPSHISALMSGVMLKVAVYGFIRMSFDLLPMIDWSWGVIVLLLGSVSSLLGVLYALMQHDLKKLLAYHSVENIGIIFMGLGLSLLFAGTGHPLLAALGLIAGLYHTLNHAVFKALLFLGAGAIVHTTGQKDMEHMGGLMRRMPWTGLFFLIGCISISALPPFNGFISEWLTFQTALQAWVLENGVLRSLIPIAAAMLALTGALAAACFVKVYGVTFLGRARGRAAKRARKINLYMRTSQGLLAVLCLLLGVFPGVLINLMNGIPNLLVGQNLTHATRNGWLWLTPINASVASYSAPLVLIAVLAIWWLSASLLRRGEQRRIRRTQVWDCGFSTPNERMQYTATAFAQPIRRVYGLLFRIEETVDTLGDGSRRHKLQVTDRLWNLLYEPVNRWVFAAARRVGRIQSGQVRGYLGWSLGTLVVLLWLIS